MADVLDASVSALKMRVLRAREALAAALHSREVTKQPAARLYIRRGLKGVQEAAASEEET
jgi:hypothetical protein